MLSQVVSECLNLNQFGNSRTIQVGEKCGETELTGPEVETSSACTRSEKRVLVSLCAIDFAPELRHAMSDDVRMLPVADYIVI